MRRHLQQREAVGPHLQVSTLSPAAASEAASFTMNCSEHDHAGHTLLHAVCSMRLTTPWRAGPACRIPCAPGQILGRGCPRLMRGQSRRKQSVVLSNLMPMSCLSEHQRYTIGPSTAALVALLRSVQSHFTVSRPF